MTADKQEALPLKKMQLTFDENKNTPLHFAAAEGNAAEVLNLVRNGHKIDPANFLGWTPLMLAAKKGHYDVVRTLIDHNADATKQNKYGMSVFLISISSGRKEIVDLLLQHLLSGGVSKQSMEFEVSPISTAILYQQMDIFLYLVEKNFNINIQAPETGITPIMIAAAKGYTDFYNAAIAKGADQHIKNKINQSAYDILHTKPNVAPTNPAVPQIPQPPQPQNYNTNPPNIIITNPYQQPTYNSPQVPHMRRSSDVMSPTYMVMPNLSPISPMGYLSSQVFFSPQMQQGYPGYSSHSPVYHTPVAHNSFLDVCITPQHYVQSPLSPAPQQWTTFY